MQSRTQYSHSASPDLTPTLTTLVHTFLLPWSFFSCLCDLTSFDSSLPNLFHRNNSQFSNFILIYLGIKSRFLTNSLLSFPFQHAFSLFSTNFHGLLVFSNKHEQTSWFQIMEFIEPTHAKVIQVLVGGQHPRHL